MKPFKHFWVLVAYAVIAVVMTWPLAVNFATSIPGIEGDAGSFVWALGWARTAVMDLGVNPFHTDYVYYPLGGATQLLWAVSLVGLVSIPLQLVFGLIVAHNLIYLAATILTAYGTFLLARYVLQDARAASAPPAMDGGAGPLPPFAMLLLTQFVVDYRRRRAGGSLLAPFAAGLVFALAPLRLGYGLAFLNLFNTEFIPFYLLTLLHATRAKSWRAAVVAGFLLGLNAYIDFQIAAFLILLTVLFAGWTLLTEWLKGDRRQPIAAQWKAWGRVVPVWFITALVAGLVALPILLAVQSDFDIEGGNYISVYKVDYSAARSYDLLSYLVPNARSTLYADAPLKIANVNSAVRADDLSALSPDRQPFAGYIVLALAAFAVLRRRKAAGFWLLIAILFALFGLGPWLHTGGQATTVPLPFLALHEIPIVNHIRIPMRYGIVVPLALAMLVALALDRLHGSLDAEKSLVRSKRGAQIPWRAVLKIRLADLGLVLIPVAILIESAVLPYPLQPLTIPKVYQEIARQPGDFTVLEIPSFHWRFAAATELYQAIHGKRILRAYTNRIAPGLAEYLGYRGTPIVVRSLRVLEGAEPGPLAPEDLAEDRQVRDAVLEFFDLHYAVLHRSWLKPDQVQNIEAYVREVLGGRAEFDDGDTVAFALPRPSGAPDPLSIDLRENIAQMYAGRGWQFQYPPANWEGEFNFVWASGARSEIYYVATQAAEGQLTLHAYAETPQRVRVRLNDQPVGEIQLTPEWKDYGLRLPSAAVRAGMNRIELEYDGEHSETIGLTTIQIQRGQHGTQTNR